jgi:hypothetical protein
MVIHYPLQEGFGDYSRVDHQQFRMLCIDSLFEITLDSKKVISGPKQIEREKDEIDRLYLNRVFGV